MVRERRQQKSRRREQTKPELLARNHIPSSVLLIFTPWRVFAKFTPSWAYLWWRRTKTDKSTLEQDNKYLHFTASLSPDSICIKNNWILNCSSPIKTVSQPSDIRSQNIVYVKKKLISNLKFVSSMIGWWLLTLTSDWLPDEASKWQHADVRGWAPSVYYPVKGETQEK